MKSVSGKIIKKKSTKNRGKACQCTGVGKRWHEPLTVQSSGHPLEVLKQSASNFFSDDVIPGSYGPLQSAR